uniref:Putative MarR family transcriptional regulator n=1 Tax=viral metagenome TaxID=1070528 RepID=A0A6M3LTG2_9ZZZZ
MDYTEKREVKKSTWLTKKLLAIVLMSLMVLVIVGGTVFHFKTKYALEDDIQNLNTQLEGRESELKDLGVELKDREGELQTKEGELSDSNEKRQQLAKDKNRIEAEKNELANTAYILSQTVDIIVEAGNDLDALLLEDDDRNRDFIGWMVDNSIFYEDNGTLYAAETRYANWKAYMIWSDNEYKRITAFVDQATDQIETQVNKLNNNTQLH